MGDPPKPFSLTVELRGLGRQEPPGPIRDTDESRKKIPVSAIPAKPTGRPSGKSATKKTAKPTKTGYVQLDLDF
jgi:hypothetical protein